MTFFASSHHRNEYDSAAEMAAANHEVLKKGEQDGAGWLDLQIFEGAQRIVIALNEALTRLRNPLLTRRFSSRARVLFGSNGRSVTTFTFRDGSRGDRGT